jgi:hypothetical protein
MKYPIYQPTSRAAGAMAVMRRGTVICLLGGLGCFMPYLAYAQSDAADPEIKDHKSASINSGGARVTTECSSKRVADCTQTTLRLKRADGRVIDLEKPKGMADPSNGLSETDSTAVAVACYRAKDGTLYFDVAYGRLPRDEYREWYHLYTTQGKLLTHNDPPIILDTDNIQRPNNEEYGALFRKLGLKETAGGGKEIETLHGN